MVIMFQTEEVATASKIILENGVLGAVCILLIVALIVVWKREVKTQERLWALTEDVKTIMSSLTSVVSSIFTATERLPDNVKKELEADMTAIRSAIDRIENKIK